jgi:mannose-6-phosphate isomerase-like protein (cupin superfamily)
VTHRAYAAFDLRDIAAGLPENADTMLVDTRLTDEAEASCRVFRIYRDIPPHYHQTCDEYLIVLSGRGSIIMGESGPTPVCQGQLVFFKKGTIHSVTLLEAPLVVLSVDTPRRDPKDVTFVNPDDGSAETFVKTKPTY